MGAVKRRLACLLRRWAHHLDPPSPEPVDYATTTVQSFVGAVDWSWTAGMGVMAGPPRPDPPPLRVVR